MAITVKPITLWRQEVEDTPGRLAASLVPFAAGGADLQVVMGYRVPGHEGQAVLEVYPVAGRKMGRAAEAVGLRPAEFPSLLVEGDNKAGLGHTLASALADAGISLSFLVTQVVGRRFSSVMGFAEGTDLKAVSAVLKKAGNPRPAARRTAAARKPAARTGARR